MKKIVMKSIIASIGIIIIISIIISIKGLDKTFESKKNENLTKKFENVQKASIEIYTKIISNTKHIDITDIKDINELVNIFKNGILSDIVNVDKADDYYIPKISFYNKFNDKIIEVSLYNLEVTIDSKIMSIAEKKVKRAREIINKYTKNAYGKIVCQKEIGLNMYYIYDNNIIKYVNEIKDLTKNADLDKLKHKVEESKNKEYYNAYLMYDNKEYGQLPYETLTLKNGYYYYYESYLINKMNNQELKKLFNMTKSNFESQTIKDIKNKYNDCKYSIL